MKKDKKDRIDITKVIDQMIEDKKFIAQMIRDGKKHELKGKYKFANPL